jgi:hypothetical protein
VKFFCRLDRNIHALTLVFLYFWYFSQLPTPIWLAKEAELVKWYEDRDLPVPIGGNFNFVRRERRVARW